MHEGLYSDYANWSAGQLVAHGPIKSVCSESLWQNLLMFLSRFQLKAATIIKPHFSFCIN